MKRFAVGIITLVGLAVSGGTIPDAYAHVQLAPQDAMKASRQDIDDIVAFYGKIEDALAKKDLNTIMTFYTDDYFHQGITKSQIRGLWENLFSNFDSLNSTHVFNGVEIKESEAIITCTGTLLGIPKTAKDKKYVTVDKWVNMDHYLSKKGGSWRIVGGASHWLIEPMVKHGREIKYQVEFHPLF